jgi:hypothetical protein
VAYCLTLIDDSEDDQAIWRRYQARAGESPQLADCASNPSTTRDHVWTRGDLGNP